MTITPILLSLVFARDQALLARISNRICRTCHAHEQEDVSEVDRVVEVPGEDYYGNKERKGKQNPSEKVSYGCPA